ncbi:hypothetical protein FKZ61_003195 [Litorilinea aerophila]|uniref:PQQ-binding-like beta-propeller repeat protein n=1 Tax=Litorilinea aerophila TaxID=1204385 RepID=A0A540VKY7_9CHLR|nr:hypothetical protein [Litorilinea aerophila]MCC9075119.1 hypothetical protein [Litorilinea aerophila]
MSYQRVSQPCRNFNILGSTTVQDPRDRREKVVLSNFAAGATGNLILVDPESGQGESLPLPGDEGAWAVLNWQNERLLVGTCPRFGYLHSLDLRTRTWAEPLRDEHETYIWNLCQGSDGLIYGGTYPGCVLLRYDPAAHRLENLGRMSDNPDNLYSRMVYAIPGHILVTCGMAEMHLALWEIATGKVRRFGRPGAQVRAITDRFLCTESEGELAFYHLENLAPMAGDASLLPAESPPPYGGTRHRIPLADGRIFAVRGQEYYVMAPGEVRPQLRPIPTPRPPTRIMTLVADEQGRLWGSSSFGQTIFCYNPTSGETWNSQVVCDQGGEVYGMAWRNGRLFLSAYAGGDHVVYDPGRPWNQVDNENPRTLPREPAGPEPLLIRPEARSVIGPDGHFWTGWMARYGVYGGGLTRVDTATLAVTAWVDPVPGQAVVGLAADERFLYFTTGGEGNGLPPKTEPFHFVVWDPQGEIVWQHTFPAGRRPREVAAAGGRVWVAVDRELWGFDPARWAWEAVYPRAAACHHLLATPDGQRLLIFDEEGLWSLDVASGAQRQVSQLPGPVRAATFTPDGTLYFAHGPALYRLRPAL